MTAASEDGPIRVAVDAMGGDHAPDAIVRGVLLALERSPRLLVDLVGDIERVRASLATVGGAEGDRLTLVHASQVLDMGEHPVAGLKAKPDNSIARTVKRVHEGESQAAFSAGNTGGVVAAATLHLDRLRGVRRPGIAVPFPTLTGTCLCIDVGANINCRPVHLLHYAHMATAYASDVLGISEPRVGVLNIGEEEGKGTSLVKETARLLRGSGLRFVGNVEGHGVFSGAADVVVCEGFLGNMILKTTEGLAETILTLLKQRVAEVVAERPESKDALRAVLGGLAARMDYATYGGAPLLGFEGVVLIGHGRSSPEAVANGVRGAAEFVARGVNARIRRALEASPEEATEGASPERHS
jgi:glycerol-3-phosphate acyltransferase PlsX